MEQYLKSNEVYVYPCAYRGQNGTLQFDPEARLNTERNATLAGKGYTTANGYVISSDSTGITFMLQGYYFKITKTVTDLDDNCYVAIRLVDTTLIGDELTRCLVNYADGTFSLDVEQNSNYLFKGLSFSDTQPEVTDNCYSLCLKANGVITSVYPIDLAKIAAGDGSLSDIFESDGTTVKKATDAKNVTDTINSKAISDIFETDGITVKEATKAINADIIYTADSTNGDKIQIGTGASANLVNAKNAANVSTTINNKAISNIFETDGITAKAATKATTATKLETTSVGSATTPVYFSQGKPTALNKTIGSANQLVYLNSGAITAGIKITESTSTPSGTGNNGDIWIQYSTEA